LTSGSALVAIARPHILFVAMAACVTFGWLLTGRVLVWLAPVVAADWFFVNLLNRVTDVAEDERNGIVGTALVLRHVRAFTAVAFGAPLLTLVATHAIAPLLSIPRAVALVIGLGYSYRLVPTTRGMRRLKEIYGAKNLGSALIFVLTGFAYPLTVAERTAPVATQVLLVAFFVLFEVTFEIFYDMRDVEGDRAEGVPTFPVVHGMKGARRLFDALLAASAAVLVLGLATGALGVREALMVVAPLSQRWFFRTRWPDRIDARACIVATHLASVELLVFLAGNAAWLAAGLPANVHLR